MLGITGSELRTKIRSLVIAIAGLSICCLCGAETVAAQNQKAVRAAGDLYAVVVGVGSFLKYKTVMKAPPNDAAEFSELLKKQTPLYRQIEVSSLVNERATRKDVSAAIEKAVAKAGERDTVIVYLSGDAKTDASASDVFFNTYDADLSKLPETAINLSDGALFKNLKAERLLVIIDACLPTVRRLTVFDVPPRAAFVTATMPGMPAYEDAKFSTSVFTHFLLEAMGGAADFSKNGVVTLEEAFKYAADGAAALRSQTAIMENRIKGDFPLAMPTGK